MDCAVDQGVTTLPAAPAGESKRLPERVRFELATPSDDPEIRRLLRENPMPGRIALSLECEPDAVR